MKRGFTNRHCPNCNGNVFVDQDNYFNPEESWYEWCLQCGYSHYLKPVTALTEELEVITATKKRVIV